MTRCQCSSSLCVLCFVCSAYLSCGRQECMYANGIDWMTLKTTVDTWFRFTNANQEFWKKKQKKKYWSAMIVCRKWNCILDLHQRKELLRLSLSAALSVIMHFLYCMFMFVYRICAYVIDMWARTKLICHVPLHCIIQSRKPLMLWRWMWNECDNLLLYLIIIINIVTVIVPNYVVDGFVFCHFGAWQRQQLNTIFTVERKKKDKQKIYKKSLIINCHSLCSFNDEDHWSSDIRVRWTIIEIAQAVNQSIYKLIT